MQKLLTLIVLMATFGIATAQTAAWPDTSRRHEVGVDVTSFLWQFLGKTDSNVYGAPSASPYWVTYRYHLHHHWNLRFAVGGSISDSKGPTSTYPGSYERVLKSSQLGLRAGVEKAQELSKRWQVFYGLDLRATWVHDYNDYHYSNGGYRYGSDSRGTDLGAAPFLGIRYRITPRFALLTEASLAFMSQKTDARNFSVPILPGYEAVPDVNTSTTGFHTVFTPPLAVIATFDL